MENLEVIPEKFREKKAMLKVTLVEKPERKKIKIKPKPEPKIRAKTALQKIFGNKNVVKDHYFSQGTGINDDNQRDILHEPSPFVYPEPLETYSYKTMARAWNDKQRIKELKLKCNERNNYTSRQNLDMLNRLYVKEPGTQSMKTILDIDPDFFTIVEGRTIGEKWNIREYVHDLRESLRARVVAGYREDEVLLIEENFMEEQRILDEIKGNYQKYVDTFEAFLSHDHQTSMELIRQAERETNKSYERYEAFRELSKDYGALKAAVYNLEEKWRNCKMYQKFLYMVSPMHWRKIHDYYHLKQNASHLSLVETESCVFEKYRQHTGWETNTLENMIETFLEDCRTQTDPVLYFKEPYELLKVFRFIELQNLNSLLHSEELAIPLEKIRESMHLAEKKYNEQINAVQDIIDSLSGEILWEEQRAKFLEELAMELINGEFRKLISDEEILNLYVFVEDVYEARVAPNDASLGVSDMMKAIEMKYRYYILQLDQLPEDKVRKAETECYHEEARVMKIAIDASRKVVQVENMFNMLQRVMRPPFEKTRRRFPYRTPPLHKAKTAKVTKKHHTGDDSEYLELFTDYCKYTDEVTDYEIDEAVNNLVRNFDNEDD
ncbi:coiled-coil domain-containing protein 38-like [Onthophagus taurus]|uniref:coiled-coil domain-containing protein 38-like n=1 Tax=Onthophagus taurus TaxID=166361 RepID=UPI000C20E7BE|nr:coiled-coil domain-containing protein 38-like [Onthophagus taurus]